MIHRRRIRKILLAVSLILAGLGITACSKTTGTATASVSTPADTSHSLQDAAVLPGATGTGISGASTSDTGISGASTSGTGTSGINTSGTGISGASTSGTSSPGASTSDESASGASVPGASTSDINSASTGNTAMDSSSGTDIPSLANPQVNTNYNSGDVAFFNSLIDRFLLNAVKDSPDSWEKFVTWDSSSPKRISKLNISGLMLSGTLDMSGLSDPALITLDCSADWLTGLTGLSQLTGLQTLYCGSNKITTLDLSGLTSITELDCGANHLSSLDVSSLTNLGKLDCDWNNLHNLDVSGLNGLYILDCGHNNLSWVKGLSGLSRLTTLHCANNQMISLDVSGLTAMVDLNCSNNLISSLDLSGSPVSILDCSTNILQSFKSRDGEITVTSNAGGSAIITEVSLKYKQAHLKAFPNPGYSFMSWKSLPDGASNTIETKIPISGTQNVAAAFDLTNRVASSPE